MAPPPTPVSQPLGWVSLMLSSLTAQSTQPTQPTSTAPTTPYDTSAAATFSAAPIASLATFAQSSGMTLVGPTSARIQTLFPRALMATGTSETDSSEGISHPQVERGLSVSGTYLTAGAKAGVAFLLAVGVVCFALKLVLYVRRRVNPVRVARVHLDVFVFADPSKWSTLDAEAYRERCELGFGQGTLLESLSNDAREVVGRIPVMGSSPLHRAPRVYAEGVDIQVTSQTHFLGAYKVEDTKFQSNDGLRVAVGALGKMAEGCFA